MNDTAIERAIRYHTAGGNYDGYPQEFHRELAAGLRQSRSLEETMQRLYDSEIHLTVHWLWDGGIDFAFKCCMEWLDSPSTEPATTKSARETLLMIGVCANCNGDLPGFGTEDSKKCVCTITIARETPFNGWSHVDRVSELADALHTLALEKYPQSTYAKKYGKYGKDGDAK